MRCLLDRVPEVRGVNQGPGPVLAGLSLIAAVNTGGAIIKALLTGLVVSYIGKMWPDLLEDAKK